VFVCWTGTTNTDGICHGDKWYVESWDMYLGSTITCTDSQIHCNTKISSGLVKQINLSVVVMIE